MQLIQPIVHAQKLERWLGIEQVEQISNAGKGWYGGPIPISGVPGKGIVVHSDGDFTGQLAVGHFTSMFDSLADRLIKRWKHAARLSTGKIPTGFSSLSDLIAEATAGKRQQLRFQKVGTTGVAGNDMSLWNVGNLPTAGGVAGGPNAGTVLTSASTGAIKFDNPSGSDTMHIVSAFYSSTVAGNALLLYDRLWHYLKTCSVGGDVISGVPTRYTGTEAKANFLNGEVTTAVANTAHNITITYVDQDGNTAEAAPAFAGPANLPANRGIVNVAGQWFMPLNTGDTGLRNITAYSQTANPATGAFNVYIGKVLAILPTAVANYWSVLDGINSAFNLVEIESNACLALLELPKTATTATTYNGIIVTVSG